MTTLIELKNDAGWIASGLRRIVDRGEAGFDFEVKWSHRCFDGGMSDNVFVLWFFFDASARRRLAEERWHNVDAKTLVAERYAEVIQSVRDWIETRGASSPKGGPRVLAADDLQIAGCFR